MDLHAALRDHELVALRASAAELFGVFTRRVQGPSSFSAVVIREDGSATLAPLGVVESGGTREAVFVRTSPLSLQFEVSALSSSDGFPCSAVVHLTAAVVPDRSDLESFCRAILGGGRRALRPRVAAYFHDEVERVVHEFARAHEADALLSSRDDAAFSSQLQAALKPLAFAAGMSIAPGVILQVQSPAFEVHRRERHEAQMREQRLEEQARARRVADHAAREHAGHLAELLNRLDEMSARSGGVRTLDLLRTFNAADRGELYRQLMNRGLS